MDQFNLDPSSFTNMNSILGQDLSIWDKMSNMFGNNGINSDSLAQNQNGMALGLGALQSLAGGWQALQQNKLQKDALDFQKQQYATNLEMNKKSFNSSISDRQDRRVSANPNAEATASYMAKWGA